jgi:translation initiation factor 2B subunit (eIF-2B alpha/beta/delta family)
VDESIQREWTINPFAFVLTCDASKIKIDWEHESYDWFDPADISDDGFDGVPRLLESLRRVWFEFDLGGAAAVLDAGLARLQDDHESGARQLASVALGVFIRVLKQLESGDAWWANACMVAWHLWKNGRESMGAPILSVMLASLDIIRDTIPDGRGPVDDAVSALDSLARQRETSVDRITRSFASFLAGFPAHKPIVVVTLSSSSTVAACLVQAMAAREMDLRILESRPLCEGAKLAGQLSSLAASRNLLSRVKVTVLTDAAAGIACQGADLLLLGADLIDRRGNVSNKTGSLPAVLAARHVSKHVRVVVVSEREKVLPFEAPGHEENDAAEVTCSWGGLGIPDSGGLRVRNVYFEWVESGLVDVYVTDEGVSDKEDVTRWAEDIERRARSVFDAL